MDEDIFKGLKPYSKAYTFNWHYVEESSLYDQYHYISYAESRNIAKAELLQMAQDMDVSFLYTTELTYLNIRIRRKKEQDRYLIDGTLYTQETYRIHLRREDQKRKVDSILADDKITHCFIKKNGLFYRDNCAGYTSKSEEAGVYNKAFACNHCRGYLEMSVIPINIPVYNAMINEKI